jgi:hypothetical protein
MRQITEYDTATGVIHRVLLLPDTHKFVTVEGMSYLDGNYPDDKFSVTDGVPVEKKPDPVTEKVAYESQLSDEELAWLNLRRVRDRLLFACDWTQVLDAPVDQAAWAVYRKELRDLPENTEDPRNPVWPTPPA